MSRHCPPDTAATTPVSGPAARGTVITIGTFDGVHVGHAALVRAAREIAGATPGVRVQALVFDPHPLTVITPAVAPARLQTFERKAARLRELGADEVVRLEPARELLDLTPEAFIDREIMPRRPVAVVEGRDFCFGKNRAGDTELLCALGARRGFAARVVEPVLVALHDHSVVRASSTLCRWLLAQGRVADAALLLGRPHTLAGTVVAGDRRGRTLGFPTANLDTADHAPGDGVYAAWARLPDGRAMPAAVNIGGRPTFAGASRTVEAHLLVSPDNARAAAAWATLPGLPEYNWGLELELVCFLRDQMRFGGVEVLRAQLARDTARVRRLCGVAGASTTLTSSHAQHVHADRHADHTATLTCPPLR